LADFGYRSAAEKIPKPFLKRYKWVMPAEPLAFGSFRLNPENGTLLRDGELLAIGQKGALILDALLARPGEVVTKARLMDAAWPGAAVEESNLSVQIASLRKALGPAPDGGDWIVTVPRVGYRLVQHRPATIPAADVVGFSRDKAGPPRLSMVVLPFANLGSDPEQEYFADGVTDSLTTDLSRIRGAVVIGRSTAFAYKAKAVDLRQIGRDLNVRYVLEGSIQRGGNRMRVNTQLLDAESGNHLWAERFDKPVADLFEMQDEIVARLARQLDAALVSAEARRAERAPHPDSMDLFFQGRVWYTKSFNPSDMAQAQVYFERALAVDPDNVDALAWNAFTDTQLVVSGFAAGERTERFAAAEVAASRALLLAPDHAFAHLAMSFVLGFTNRIDRAIAECERAVELDRNLAFAHAIVGMHKLHLDRGEETEAHVQKALRLSPREPQAFTWLAVGGYAKDYLGRYEEAVAWQRRSIEANGNFPTAHFHLAIALAHLGRLEEARAAARVGLTLNPHFTIAGHRAGNIFSDSPAHLAWRERQYEGLRKAGVPEG
jgi:TolB-like protein/Tfp pilus assembly protein PilF